MDQQLESIQNSQPNKPVNGIFKAAILIAAGLLIVAGLFYAAYYWRQKDDLGAGSPTGSAAPASEMPDRGQNLGIKDDLSDLCLKNTVDQYGSISEDKDILIYESECIFKIYPSNSTDSLIRFYATDGAGTFNRLIFETVNKAAFGGSTYGELAGLGKNKIKIHRVSSGEDSAVIDALGASSSLSEMENLNVSVSPDGKFMALSIPFQRLGTPSDEYAPFFPADYQYKPGFVYIKKVANGEISGYDFSSAGIDGSFIAGWSPDSGSVFVAGGLYEFAAPAALTKIEVASNKATRYDLGGFSYPVNVYPKERIALFRDKSGFLGLDEEPKENVTISLFEMNLDSGDKKAVITEKATEAFYRIAKIGNDIFYLLSGIGVDRRLKKGNLATGETEVIHNGPAQILAYSEEEEYLVLRDNREYKIWFTASGRERFLGDGGGQIGFRVAADNKEYIADIVGVIKQGGQ